MKLDPQKIKIGDTEYIIGRLDMFQSVNLTRMASPMLPILFNEVFKNVIKSLFASKKLTEANIEDVLEEISSVIGICEPVLIRLAQMPEENFNKIIKICLGCIERKQGDHWFKVMEGGVLRFDDMDQYLVFNLVLRVIVREVGPIFAASFQSAQEAARK